MTARAISSSFFFFFNDTATTEIYTLSYTTLFRSQLARQRHDHGFADIAPGAGGAFLEPLRQGRSEEHTSELQSRLHLVCRLLLEKKKNASEINAATTGHAVHYGDAPPHRTTSVVV